jgi:thiamine-monophosphate kinase
LEESLIAIIKKIIDSDNHIGDDCAVIELCGEKYLFSLDNLVEHTHFSQEYFSPYDIGWKALAVNISDISAMAGKPLMALIGLNLQASLDNKESWVREFYSGINDCAKKFGEVKIIGGDLCKSNNETSVSVTIIGKSYEDNKIFMRTGAKTNYKVCVTGEFGASAKFLQNTSADIGKNTHLRPEPRLKEADYARKTCAEGALMDSSDGLAQALICLAEANKLDIEIDPDSIPIAEGADLNLALYGGEDYELVGCFPEVPQGFKLIGVCLASSDSPKVKLSKSELILDKTSYFQHFIN